MISLTMELQLLQTVKVKKRPKLYIFPLIVEFPAMNFKVYGSKHRLFKLDTDIFTATDDLEKVCVG